MRKTSAVAIGSRRDLPVALGRGAELAQEERNFP
jgi:hypothetical protein